MRLALLIFLAGCIDQRDPPLIPTSCSAYDYLEAPAAGDLDMLFVIDDSPAMAPYLDALAANASVFINILQLPYVVNLHLAVARASDGTFVDPVPCGAQAGTQWLYTLNHGASRNYTGTLQGVFNCMIRVGTAAAPPLQTLASATAGLSAHPDFLRTEAFLFVTIITPQDDASSGDPGAYRDALNALKVAPNHVGAATIAHPMLPRLTSFIDSFGYLATRTSIDDPNWSPALSLLFPIEPPIRRFCIGTLTQPPRCTFTRVQSFGTPMQRQIGTLPPCNPNGQAAGVCAALLPQPNCPSETGVELCYNGFDPSNASDPCPLGNVDPIEGEIVVVECAIACD